MIFDLPLLWKILRIFVTITLTISCVGLIHSTYFLILKSILLLCFVKCKFQLQSCGITSMLPQFPLVVRKLIQDGSFSAKISPSCFLHKINKGKLPTVFRVIFLYELDRCICLFLDIRIIKPPPELSKIWIWILFKTGLGTSYSTFVPSSISPDPCS